MARSLAERLRAHEQQKARLAEQEAKLKDAGRKARTRRLIEAGGLVEKTGLLDLDPNALYGALLSLRDGSSNAKQVEQWAALGGRTFAREARARDEGKEPIVPDVPGRPRQGSNRDPAHGRLPVQQGAATLGGAGAHRGRPTARQGTRRHRAPGGRSPARSRRTGHRGGVTWLRLVLAAWVILAGSLPAYAATANRDLARIPSNLVFLFVVATVLVVMGDKAMLMGSDRRLRAARRIKFIFGMPLCWLVLSLVHAETGWFASNWIALPLWLGLVLLMFAFGQNLVPGPLRRWFAAMYPDDTPTTHGSAHFGTAAIGARHLAPAAPADAFVLGYMPGAPRKGDARFRQDGHILTCAPTGAGKGVGGVIPNLLDYPGSAFVLDFKGENYAVTARARRELGHQVILVDPFGITGDAGPGAELAGHIGSRLSRCGQPRRRPGGHAGAPSRAPTRIPHWTDTARELLRGLLVYVATLPADRRTMAELRRIVTASERDLADTLDEMQADPEAGQRIPARAAAAHLNRPERERGSVLSTVVRHTAWLDDPRLCAALARSDFNLADLKRQPMTVYLAIPPDRLRACLGFVRGFIGLALDGITAAPGKPAAPGGVLPR